MTEFGFDDPRVTDVEFQRLPEADYPHLATAKVTLNQECRARVVIAAGRTGPYVVRSRRRSGGRFADIAHPVSRASCDAMTSGLDSQLIRRFWLFLARG